MSISLQRDKHMHNLVSFSVQDEDLNFKIQMLEHKSTLRTPYNQNYEIANKIDKLEHVDYFFIEMRNAYLEQENVSLNDQKIAVAEKQFNESVKQVDIFNFLFKEIYPKDTEKVYKKKSKMKDFFHLNEKKEKKS